METITNLRGHIKAAVSSLAVQMCGAAVWGEDAAQQADHSTSCCQFYRAEALLLTGAFFLHFLSQRWPLIPLLARLFRANSEAGNPVFFGRPLETKVKTYGNYL